MMGLQKTKVRHYRSYCLQDGDAVQSGRCTLQEDRIVNLKTKVVRTGLNVLWFKVSEQGQVGFQNGGDIIALVKI